MTTAETHKTRTVDPDEAEATGSPGDVVYRPDGTVAFTDSGRIFWRPRLAKVGIDIDTIETRADWGIALELSVTSDTNRKSGLTELAALLTVDPAERAALKRKAAALRVKERRAAFRVVTSHRPHCPPQGGSGLQCPAAMQASPDKKPALLRGMNVVIRMCCEFAQQ